MFDFKKGKVSSKEKVAFFMSMTVYKNIELNQTPFLLLGEELEILLREVFDN